MSKLDFGFIDGMQEEETATDTAVALVKNDIEKVKQKFSGYRKRIEEMRDEVETFEVKSDRDAKALTSALGRVAQLKVDVDEQRKEIIKPQDTYVRGVNSFVKTFRDILDSITATGKKKIGEHGRMVELKRRADEKKLEDARKTEQAKLDKMAKKEGVVAPVVPKMVAPVVTTPIRTESGSSSTKMHWVWIVEELYKVPRKYLTENKDALDKAVDAGIRDIPGVSIFEEPKVRISRR